MINWESILSSMDAARRSAAANLRIGQLLTRLDALSDNTPITLTSGEHLAGTSCSYRGYYEDLMLEIGTEDRSHDTAGGLRRILEAALERGVMHGYKGGEYPITASTLVWTGTYGESGGGMVVDLLTVEGKTFLVVKPEGD